MLSGSAGVKAACKHVDEIDPWYRYPFSTTRCAFSSNHVVTINQERVSEREEEITDRRNAAPEEA